MTKEKETLQALERELQERVKRSSEPFKGTLAQMRGAAAPSVDENNQVSNEERKSTKKGLSSFEQKIREKIKRRKKAFHGCLGSLGK